MARRSAFCSLFVLATGLLAGPVITDVDEVLHKEDKVVLVSYSPWSYQCWNSKDLEGWVKGKREPGDWVSLVKPTLQFSPQQILFGQARNFLVVETIAKRIWQLDSGMQILSSLRLPGELETKLAEFRVFWTEGHRLTFVNVSEGLAYQYLESSGTLSLLRKQKIPLSCKSCFQAKVKTGAYSRREYPFVCITADAYIVFDMYFTGSKEVPFNAPAGSVVMKERSTDAPVLLLEESRNPVLEYQVSDLTFCFNSETREFSYCPGE
ncbi:hypothetical protein ACFL5V_01010 [Fibrobacterota bacterium]